MAFLFCFLVFRLRIEEQVPVEDYTIPLSKAEVVVEGE